MKASHIAPKTAHGDVVMAAHATPRLPSLFAHQTVDVLPLPLPRATPSKLQANSEDVTQKAQTQTVSALLPSMHEGGEKAYV